MLETFGYILLLPFWIAMLIMSAKLFGLKQSKKMIILLSVIGVLILIVYSSFGLYSCYSNKPYSIEYSFISIDDLSFKLGIYVDILSSILGVTISIITLAVYVYSIFYMDKEKSFSRYFSLMNVFLASILCFVYSPNLFQMLLSWFLIGAVSYLLVGFWYTKESVSLNAKRVFLINVLGDICLFAVFVVVSSLIYFLTNDTSLASIPFEELNLISTYLVGATSPQIYTFITILLVIAASIKSAQFPMNSWLINAMSAPTPASALIHSSTLVIAGVYLLVRLFPIIVLDSISLKIILIIGLFTAVIASLCALVQNNIKKVLAYSTSSQMGLVFIAVGSYNPIAAVIYIISHAFIKSLLFMCSGVPIKLVNNKNILFMGGLRKCIPFVAICFLVGAIALSGLGFCGFSAKCILIETYCTNTVSLLIFAFIGALTALYIFRLYFVVFETKTLNSAECGEFKEKLESPLLSIVTNTVLSTISFIIIILSFILPVGRLCPLYIVNFLMILLAYWFYKTNRKFRFSILKNALINGLYLDKLYNWIEVKLYKHISDLCVFIDTNVLCGLENATKKTLFLLTKYEHHIQTNNFQTYFVYGIWILIFLFLIFSMIYLLILNIFGV